MVVSVFPCWVSSKQRMQSLRNLSAAQLEAHWDPVARRQPQVLLGVPPETIRETSLKLR